MEGTGDLEQGASGKEPSRVRSESKARLTTEENLIGSDHDDTHRLSHTPMVSEESLVRGGENLTSGGESSAGGSKADGQLRDEFFICIPLGRPLKWKLHHARFRDDPSNPSDGIDRRFFEAVLEETDRYLGSRGLLRFLFPLRISKVEYWEVSIFCTSRTKYLRMNVVLSLQRVQCCRSTLREKASS